MCSGGEKRPSPGFEHPDFPHPTVWSCCHYTTSIKVKENSLVCSSFLCTWLPSAVAPSSFPMGCTNAATIYKYPFSLVTQYFYSPHVEHFHSIHIEQWYPRWRYSIRWLQWSSLPLILLISVEPSFQLPLISELLCMGPSCLRLPPAVQGWWMTPCHPWASLSRSVCMEPWLYLRVYLSCASSVHRPYILVFASRWSSCPDGNLHKVLSDLPCKYQGSIRPHYCEQYKAFHYVTHICKYVKLLKASPTWMSECLYCGFTMVSRHVKEDGYTVCCLECQCRQVHDFYLYVLEAYWFYLTCTTLCWPWNVIRPVSIDHYLAPTWNVVIHLHQSLPYNSRVPFYFALRSRGPVITLKLHSSILPISFLCPRTVWQPTDRCSWWL